VVAAGGGRCRGVSDGLGRWRLGAMRRCRSVTRRAGMSSPRVRARACVTTRRYMCAMPSLDLSRRSGRSYRSSVHAWRGLSTGMGDGAQRRCTDRGPSGRRTRAGRDDPYDNQPCDDGREQWPSPPEPTGATHPTRTGQPRPAKPPSADDGRHKAERRIQVQLGRSRRRLDGIVKRG
jgi:hypothetical protein